MNSEKDSMFEGEHNEFTKNENETFERVKYISTLPSTFNTLVGKIVKIETEEPRYVIELLGDLLGITDYKTNKAAFWFLDTIALQVLRYKDCLDDHCRSILISWLAGEMKLIRDKKLLREDFFKEMRILFLYVAEKLSGGDQLPHWELLINESEIISKDSTIDESAKSEVEYLITNKSLEKELMVKHDKRASRENEPFFIEKDLKTDDDGNSVANNLQKKLSKIFETSLTAENSQTDLFTDANAVVKSSNVTNPNIILDIIIEATYSMYANELRYALIYAVFVTPIQIQIYQMPHTLRIPRPIKLADPERGSFDMQLRERLEKTANELAISNGKKHKGKKKADNMRKERTFKDLNMEIPPTPPSSLIEEEILANNRRFILPLIEAKEAAQIYEMHAGNI